MAQISISEEIITRVAVRWAANSFGLWVAGRILPGVDHGDNLSAILLAALVLSLVNALLKPLAVIISLPAIIFTLGAFLIVINGFMVWLSSLIVSSFRVDSLAGALLAGIIIGLVNYVVTTYLEEKLLKRKS